MSFICALLLDSFIILNPAPKQDLLFKYAPFYSPLIVILTFIFNNWYTAYTKRKESRRTWYFKAYFEPQLKKVEEFFSNADLMMRTGLEIDEKETKTRTVDENIEFIGETLFNLANLKRKFELEVVKMFQSKYPKIFSSLETILMNFEDACTKAFDKENEEPYFTFLDEINQIKSQVIHALSEPALK